MVNQKSEKSLKEQYIESQKNAFFREVQEDVQAEKVAIFWHKYKRYIITTIIEKSKPKYSKKLVSKL